MTPQILLRQRINSVFLLMILTLATQSVAVLPAAYLTVYFQLTGQEVGYFTEFVMPQALYPICNIVLVFVFMRVIAMPLPSVTAVKPIRRDFFPWCGLFLFLSMGMNYAVTGFLWVLEQLGLVLPDIFEAYNPSTPFQAVCYFVVLAILPAISEELLCRSSFVGLMKHLNPWVAVVLSAFSFGLIHANLPQIPFAIVLGLLFGFIYVKTGNLLYPILFHFINNAWACLLTFVSVWCDERTLNWMGYGGDLVFLLLGVASLIYLLVKKQFTLKEIPRSLSFGEGMRVAVSSPTFWIFTAIYTVMTLLLLVDQFLIAA